MFRKLYETQIYRDPDFYSSFPGVANLGNGEIFAVFRRAPRYRGLPGLPEDWYVHLDRNSKLVSVRSFDNGRTWSAPRTLFAPDAGAAQDGGVMFDGDTLFVNSFIWGNLPDAVIKALRESGRDEYIYSAYGGSNVATHVGSFALRSRDKGANWEGPFFPDPIPGYPEALPGRPLLMHNRANIVRMPDGRLLYPGQALRYRPQYSSGIVLFESSDDGATWRYLAAPAPDGGTAVFEEPCLVLTKSGKLVLIIRTHKTPEGREYRLPDEKGAKRAMLWKCESSDGGRTWNEPVDLGIHGEPAAACVMDDGRILLVYGYRIEPYGVRGRICNAELTDIAEAEEFVVRDDGGRPDCGYPWVTALGNGRYMIVYYLNRPGWDGSGGIFATVAEIR
ncbi:MAG: exo-alpha-sialidase [Lentisphaeria bacterium]|nr:exo-alpha-sialidase [Lentisphaeria bacterium]